MGINSEGRVTSLINNLYSRDDRTTRNNLRKKLRTLDGDTLDLIEEATTERYRVSPSTIIRGEERSIREAAFYGPRCTHREINPYDALTVIRGLHFLDRYQTMIAMDRFTGTELDIATAYLNVTSAIYAHAGEYLDFSKEYQREKAGYIKNPVLQDLIAVHYQQADAIIRYIDDRKTADPELLLAYLEDESPLREGVL